MTAPTRSAIPTTYRGTNFRSRLEAKWAAFFDLVGWRWTYEPIDADGYIPDFLIHGPSPFYVEVGPCVGLPDYVEKAKKADDRAHLLRLDVLVVGVSPISPLPTTHYGYRAPALTAGFLGEFHDDSHFDSHDVDCEPGLPCDHVGYAWGAGVWAVEKELAVFHDVMSYGRRPFGGGDPSHPKALCEASWLEGAWASASNDTQWRGQPESVHDVLRRLGR